MFPVNFPPVPLSPFSGRLYLHSRALDLPHESAMAHLRRWFFFRPQATPFQLQ